MAEPKIPRSNQESGESVLKDENQVLKPPPRRKKSLRKSNMEAESTRKTTALHAVKSVNEQSEASLEDNVFEEGISSASADNNNTNTAVSCNDLNKSDCNNQRLAQQKYSDNECENYKSTAQNKSDNKTFEKSKAGETPGSFSQCKMTKINNEVSKTEKRNSKDDNILDKKVEIEQDDEMGNKNGSIKSKAKNHEPCNPGNIQLTINDSYKAEDSLNGNQEVKNGDTPVVVNENFETSFCLVEKSNGEIKAQTVTKVEDSKQSPLKEKEYYWSSCTDSAETTSGIRYSDCGNFINSGVDTNSKCVNTSSCDNQMDDVDDPKDCAVQEPSNVTNVAEGEEETRLKTNDNKTILNNPGRKDHENAVNSSSAEVESLENPILTFPKPMCKIDTSGFKTSSTTEEQCMQKECIADSIAVSDFKQENSIPEESEIHSKNMNHQLEEIKSNDEISVPYQNLEEGSTTQDDICSGYDEEEEYWSDTDSDTYYSDSTNSEGEYHMEDAEKLCGVEVLKHEVNLPVSKEVESESINQILSAFKDTETVTVTDDTDSHHGNDSRDETRSHGNEELELSEARALSLKRKIGSFKVVKSLAPAIDEVDVKEASVGITTEVVATGTESPLDNTKTAELAILALHKEHKMKHSGRKIRVREQREEVVPGSEKTSKKLEISRPRSVVGEPRTRSRSTGDLDKMAGKPKRRVKKKNSLPVRARSLKLTQDSKVDFDEKLESPLFNEDNVYLPGVLKGGIIASMSHLEESRERRESGSPLFKQQSLKRESETQKVAEAGLEDICVPVSEENNSTSPGNSSISPSTDNALETEASVEHEKSASHGLEEQRSNSADRLSVITQVDALTDEASLLLRRPLSAVREESSLDSGPSFSLSSRGSSVSQEHKTQAEEASIVAVNSETSSKSNVSMLECEDIPITDDTTANLEKWELESGVRDEGSSIENDISKGINITIPSSTHREDTPTKMSPSPKRPESFGSGIEKSNDSVKNVQLRQLKITQAKRKWLTQSTVVETELPLCPTNVRLTSFKKTGELDWPDSGFPDRQTVSESPAGENGNNKDAKQVSFVETQESTPEEQTIPTRPPRKGKLLNHSVSFSASPNHTRKTPTKQVKGSRRREGLPSRWQTLSVAIDADWLARLSSTNKLPIDSMSKEQITLVTDAIPACFPTFPTDKRSQIVLELYTTERTYVRGLEIVLELFRNPLEDYLEPKEKAAMFSNVDDIFKVNKDVLFSLCEKVNHWKDDQVIGHIFVENAARFKIYATYCNNYDAAENLIKQKIKKKKEFDDFLEACYKNEVCQPGLKLPAYLITVVQRIPRYLLLLRDLVKCTPHNHPDARAIKEGLHKMHNIAEYINNQLQAVQGQRAMTELRSRVIGIKAFETPGRALIKEGEVYIMNTKRTYKCLLFNDMVVFAAKNVNKRSEVQLTLEVESIWVADLEDNDPQTSKEDAIELYTPERSYTMYTGTRNEKKHWLQKLRTAIAIRLHGEMATDSCEIEHRKSDFTYKDGRIYCGIFVDGKRQGPGVLAWQNRTRYVGNFEDDERNGIGELTYSTGEKYKGEWLDDKQHGLGTLTYPNNDDYTGEWKRGKMNGQGLIRFNNGDILNGEFVDNEVCGSARLECANGLTYDGTWRNSKKHGRGTLVKPYGDTYDGEFSNDRISGTGTMLYASKSAKYEGQWENNQRHGNGVYSAPDGTRYEGEWRGDHMSGRGKMLYASGETYDGSWHRDMRFGKGVFACQEGIYDGKFEYNVRHGIGQMHYKDHSHYDGEWQHDQRHGQGKMLYADNSEYEGNWMLSLRNGRGKMTFSNGATYEGNWDLGSEHGPDGVFKDNANNYSYEGGWEYGCKQGQGVETTSNGTYDGDFKANVRHGKGVETLRCGTVYEGQWRDNRKVGEGVRKTKWGETETSEVQYWKEGQLLNKDETIAPDLPFIQRITK